MTDISFLPSDQSINRTAEACPARFYRPHNLYGIGTDMWCRSCGELIWRAGQLTTQRWEPCRGAPR